jgi:hypothetical protein
MNSLARRGLLIAVVTLLGVAPAAGNPGRERPRTRLSISGQRWRLNGEPTCRGTPAEGLPPNVRMVNAVFEDRRRPAFDAERNTESFLARLPDYVSGGIRAITLNLQGGMPGYEGAVNSAFRPDGSLRMRNAVPRTAGKKAEMLRGQRSIGGSNNQTDHLGSYSFLWWVNGIDREGVRHWPDLPVDACAALGHGGKRGLLVVPSLDLVVSWNDARIDGGESENRVLRPVVGAVSGMPR